MEKERGLHAKLDSPLNFQISRDFETRCAVLRSGSIVSSAAMIGAVHRSSQSQLWWILVDTKHGNNVNGENDGKPNGFWGVCPKKIRQYRDVQTSEKFYNWGIIVVHADHSWGSRLDGRFVSLLFCNFCGDRVYVCG